MEQIVNLNITVSEDVAGYTSFLLATTLLFYLDGDQPGLRAAVVRNAIGAAENTLTDARRNDVVRLLRQLLPADAESPGTK